ncbi:MAG: 16S rRNA (cytosine(1402)-N(4))-methyltransferase, partial [Caldilineae bacterium]
MLPPDPEGVDHVPVLLDEVIQGLAVRPGGRYIDGTLGGGGHTAALLEHSAPDGRVLGLDADPAAIRRVQERLREAIQAGRLVVVQSPFEKLGQVARSQGFHPVDGVLLDLGLSSFQLGAAERGFAFSEEGPLDMRFDPAQEISAADIVNRWSEKDL